MLSRIIRTWCVVRSSRRSFSSSSSRTLGPGTGPGLVLLSESTDVFQNLALEDWLESNLDLQQRRVLLLWRNRACVVVGRHQNPWAECDLGAMRRVGVPLARRRSGGGTVFHDLGNLNITFFTDRKWYDRNRNLRVVTDALRRLQPQLQVDATERLDILLNGHLKISGSASRLSKKSSYHHCTLLHSADRSALSSMLRPSCPGIRSNATPSVPSPVANLRDHAPSLGWAELLEGLALQHNIEFGLSAPLTFVDPADESSFPGIQRLAAELRSWEWTFGKTPKFSVETELQLLDAASQARSSARLQLEVKGGVIDSCELDVPADWVREEWSRELCSVLLGERFSRSAASGLVAALLRRESGEQRSRLHTLCDAVISIMG